MFECGLFHDENGYLCKSESWSLVRLKKAIRYDSCADPGIFVRWWGGGPGPSGVKKKSSDIVFFLFLFFLVLHLFYKSPRKLLFVKVPVGLEHFPGGGLTFYRGFNCFFPIKTHITCEFPGVRTPAPPPPPLDLPMWFRASWFNLSTRFSLFFFNITFAKSFVERGGNVVSAAMLPVVVVIKY